MVENPNQLHHLHLANGAVLFDYHGWHARLLAVNDHLLRLTVTADAWPQHPSIPQAPEITKHADETVATGGNGQQYQTPIVTATDQRPLNLHDHQISLGAYTVNLKAGEMVIRQGESALLTQILPQLTGQAWTTRIKTDLNAHYFGGGVQNGQIEQTGRLVAIKNENRWTRGSVSSPVPFYWTTSGYGFLANTFMPGEYDFGDPLHGAYLTHEASVYDAYLILGQTPASLVGGYYELTGQPVRLPAFAFYPAHFNAYNRNYWVGVTADSPGARQFADGHWYKAYSPLNKATFNLGFRPGTITVNDQPLVPNVYSDGQVTFTDADQNGMPKTAIRESLNGEHDPQFSGRAVIDRYAEQGFPLGWMIPNDGYGSGYGQTNSFAGDLANLKAFIQYANAHGIQVGLWTQAQLSPETATPQKNDRDLQQEIEAGSRAVKTDVAWIGEGYTFGVNATAKIQAAFAAHLLRALTVTLDGWAGTQRAALVWTGDQTGGTWRNLETHVGSYLAAGLSGQPHIASDVDGIYDGGDPIIQTRDLQWKAFTPSFFAMDGWGTQPKLMGMEAPTAAINRAFLQYHTMLVPYLYSLATQTAPIMRPTFWADPDALAPGELADQFMVGASLLVAPIVRPYYLQPDGRATRASVYLPHGDWFDFWTGTKMAGDQTLSDVPALLDQLPVYVKAGSIIPLALPHQNPAARSATRLVDYWPGPASTFTLVEDDGATLAYQTGEQATTLITAESSGQSASLTINATKGQFAGQTEIVPVQLFVAGPAPTQVTARSGETAIAVQMQQGLRVVDPLNRSETGVTINVPAHSIREPLTFSLIW